MSTQTDGGPAFPAPAGVQHITTCGMTLRDYFAARAPETPASWFKPSLPVRPPDKWVGCDGWQFDTEDDAATRCGLAYSNDNAPLIAKWEEECAVAKYVQWRWAYADAMLAARQGGAK